MTSKNISQLRNFLSEIKIIKESELEKLLHTFPDRSISDNIACKFYMLRATGEDVREADFIDFLLKYIVQYVLRKEEYLPKVPIEELPSKYMDIVRKARKKFIRRNPKTGEPGELILFLILESQGIIQLLNKMNLKTSSEMPIHGLDAIHMQVDDQDCVVLYYGQAKMHQDFNSCVDSALKDVKNFDREQEQYELNLVSSYIDDSRFDPFVDEIIDILSPYGKHKENLKHAHSIFLGYSWDILQDLHNHKGTSLTDSLLEKYGIEQSKLFDVVKNSISKLESVNRYTFRCYVLPFKNVKDFRDAFVKELSQ